MSINDEKWFKDRTFRPDVISEDYAEPSDSPEYWGDKNANEGVVRVREYLLENRMGTLADQSEDIVSRMGRSMADIIKQEKDNINNQ